MITRTLRITSTAVAAFVLAAASSITADELDKQLLYGDADVSIVKTGHNSGPLGASGPERFEGSSSIHYTVGKQRGNYTAPQTSFSAFEVRDGVDELEYGDQDPDIVRIGGVGR